MATVLEAASGPLTRTNASTLYIPLGDTDFSGTGLTATTESLMQVIRRTPGTFTNLYVSITTNGNTSALMTFHLRINGANGNEGLSIVAGTTGEFYDDETDVVSAGQLVCCSWNAGSTSSSTIAAISINFAASNNTTTKRHVANPGTSNLGTTAKNFSISGSGTSTALDPSTTFPAGTFQNLFANVTTNTYSTTTTFYLKQGGGASILSISVTAGSTGVFEDTTDTVPSSSNNPVNYSLSGNPSGTIIIPTMGVEFATLNSISVVNGSDQTARGFSGYYGFGGGSSLQLVFNQVSSQPNLDITVIYIFVLVSANNSITSSFSVVVDGVNVILLSVPSLTTGTLSNVLSSSAVKATSNLGFGFVWNGSGNITTQSIATYMQPEVVLFPSDMTPGTFVDWKIF